MRQILKDKEPESLTQFKIANPSLKYENLKDGFESIRIEIRNACVKNQFFLCAYCCDRITLKESHNEHILPQSHSLGQSLTLDYNNIIASCQSLNHCGHRKKNQLIDINPLQKNCETDIIYLINGKMTHKNQSAQSTINVLNLRESSLKNKRKNIIDIILFEYVEDINTLALEDSEYLKLIIEEISKPDEHGKLEAFTPVIINVLNNFI